MARFPFVPPPPPAGVDPEVAAWMNAVTDIFNELPAFSHFSTATGPTTAQQPASIGTLGVELGSGTTKLWVMKEAGWTAIQ